MNRNLFILLLSLLAGLTVREVRAQQPLVLADVVQGEILQISDSLQFALPAFHQGTVLFHDRTTATARLNLNIISHRTQFIDPRGDTLSVVNESDIHLVYVDGRVFQKNSGQYIEILQPDRDISLAVLQKLVIEEPGKKGAYGTVSHTTSIASCNSFMDAVGKVYDLSQTRNLRCWMTYTPYLYKNERLYIASRKSFIKVFPHKKAFIEDYLSSRKVRFDDVHQVSALLEACMEK